MKDCCKTSVSFGGGEDYIFCPKCGTRHRRETFAMTPGETASLRKSTMEKKYLGGQIFSKMRNRDGTGREFLTYLRHTFHCSQGGSFGGPIKMEFVPKPISIIIQYDRKAKRDRSVMSVQLNHMLKTLDESYVQTVSAEFSDDDVFNTTPEEFTRLVKKRIIPVFYAEIHSAEYNEYEETMLRISDELTEICAEEPYNDKEKKCM